SCWEREKIVAMGWWELYAETWPGRFVLPAKGVGDTFIELLIRQCKSPILGEVRCPVHSELLMIQRLRCNFVLVAVAMLLSFNPVSGEEPEAASGENSQATEQDVQELTQPLVDDITLFGIREDGTRYRVEQPRLLMKIYAPDRGRHFDRAQTGALWAWGEGRPVALTEFWRWERDQAWGHTLISTTPGLVTATVDKMTWKPEQPGLKFTELPIAPPPAENESGRNEQMSQIVQRFSGFEIVKRRVVDLAMLPEPLHRYTEDGIDGALFALAQGENPEAFLFLEAVSDPV